MSWTRSPSSSARRASLPSGPGSAASRTCAGQGPSNSISSQERDRSGAVPAAGSAPLWQTAPCSQPKAGPGGWSGGWAAGGLGRMTPRYSGWALLLCGGGALSVG